MKETINDIQTRLDQLYNRTQVNSMSFFLLSLCSSCKCKDRPFYFMRTFTCSGSWPDLAQHQQPPGERRGQWAGWSGQRRRRNWGKPAEHSEGKDTDGAGEEGVPVLLCLPGETQHVKIRPQTQTLVVLFWMSLCVISDCKFCSLKLKKVGGKPHAGSNSRKQHSCISHCTN